LGHINKLLEQLRQLQHIIECNIARSLIRSGHSGLYRRLNNATANRILSLIRAILNRAKDEWGWIDSVPNFRFLPEPNERIRWLTHDEARRLLTELPSHLEAMARFSLATGLSEANVTGLRWAKIDMKRECAWVEAHQAKSGK